MVGSERSEPQSDVTEEPAAVVSPLRPRCVVPKAQRSGVNRGDQRVPVYWDQTVPVWRAGGSKARKTPANRRERCRDDPQSQAGDGDASSSSNFRPSEVSFDAILSMYESSLVEKSLICPRCRRSRSRSGSARDDRRFPVRLVSETGEPEAQTRLRAAIERASIYDVDRDSAHSSHHCDAMLLDRRRSWRVPLSFPTPMLTSSSS